MEVWADVSIVGLSFYDNGTFDLASQNATIGDVLTWDGSSWAPSAPDASSTSVVYSASSGISIDDDVISLDESYEISNPIHIKNSSDESLLKISDTGQLMIGFENAYNYSIVSKGFNYFSNLISRYQASVGTTNIGTVTNGPTLWFKVLKLMILRY